MSEMSWFEKAIRDHEKEHGPSGGAWNISMILDRLWRAHKEENKICSGCSHTHKFCKCSLKP